MFPSVNVSHPLSVFQRAFSGSDKSNGSANTRCPEIARAGSSLRALTLTDIQVGKLRMLIGSIWGLLLLRLAFLFVFRGVRSCQWRVTSPFLFELKKIKFILQAELI